MPRLSYGPSRRYDIAPGITAAELNAMITARSVAGSAPITCAAGEYGFTEALVWKPYVQIRGVGTERTRFVCDYATSDADVQTNALIGGATSVGSVIGTLTARVTRYSTVLPCSSVTGLAVGDWIECYGDMTGAKDESDLDSQDETVHLGQIASIASLNVTLYQPTRTHLKSGYSVRKVTGSGSFELSDLTLDGSAATALAVGIDLPYARDCRIERVAFKGFSRAGVGVRRGATNLLVADSLNLGANNALVFADAAHGVRITGTRTATGSVDRYHASGTTRFAVTCRGDCDALVVEDNTFERWSGGVETRMAHGPLIAHNIFRDCVPDEASTRMTTAGENNTGQFGIVMSSSPVLAESANVVGATIIGNKFLECTSQLTVETVFCLYLHDQRTMQVEDNTIVNMGGTNAANLGAILNKDSGGVIANTTVRGMPVGIYTVGSFGADIDGVRYEIASGGLGASVSSVPLRFSVTGAVTVRNVQASANYFSQFSGTNLNAAQVFENCTPFGAYKYTRIRVAFNKAGGTLGRGDVAAIDNAGTEASSGYMQVKTATGAADEELVVVVEGALAANGNTDGSLMLVAILSEQTIGSVMVKAADTIRPGDLGTVDAAGAGGGTAGKYMKLDNAPAAGVARVRFTGRKTGTGAAAFVEFTHAL